MALAKGGPRPLQERFFTSGEPPPKKPKCKKTEAEKAKQMKKKKSREVESIVGQDQKETEEAPQTGRGADRNARKKPNPDEHGAEYFR